MNKYAGKKRTTVLRDLLKRRVNSLFWALLWALLCVCGSVLHFEKVCSGKNWVTDRDMQDINTLASKSTSQAISRHPGQLLICRKWFIDAQGEAFYEVAFFKCWVEGR